MADAAGRISTLQVLCPCGKDFKNADFYLNHKQLCVNHQEGEKIISKTLRSNRRAATVPIRASESGSRPEKKLCLCGQSFKTQKKLEKHSQFSKTHRSGNTKTGNTSKGKKSASMPIMSPYVSPNPNSPTSGIVPGTSSPSVAPPIPATDEQTFETQRVLDIYKRDSVHHGRQAEKSLDQDLEEDDSFVSSFASLKLESVTTQARNSVARLPCVCGCTFTCQEDLATHRQEERRLAWRPKEKGSEKRFKTPRPQYRLDEVEQDRAVIFARQCYDGE